MAIRAGSYNSAKPIWRGVIREDGGPLYVCIHRDHPDQPAATKCARNALYVIKRSSKLPAGWIHYGKDA